MHGPTCSLIAYVCMAFRRTINSMKPNLLMQLMHDFASELNSGGEIDALFIDLSNFDKVPHIKLATS